MYSIALEFSRFSMVVHPLVLMIASLLLTFRLKSTMIRTPILYGGQINKTKAESTGIGFNKYLINNTTNIEQVQVLLY